MKTVDESLGRDQIQKRSANAKLSRVVRLLTWFNSMVIPIMFVLFFIGLSIDTDFFKANSFGPGYLISGLIKAIWLIVPLTTVMALVLNLRLKSKPAIWTNLLILAFWLTWAALMVFGWYPYLR